MSAMHSKRLPSAGAVPMRPAARSALLAILALGLAVLAAGCSSEGPPGELRAILPGQHQIAHPGVIDASATGEGCGPTRTRALTSAQRVAHFNLRTLTGQGRYNVRFDLVGERETAQGVCIQVNAVAVAPRPHLR